MSDLKTAKRGPKPKLSLEEKISIFNSYYMTNLGDPGVLKKHGLFTRLMKYASENGYVVNNINAFSEDADFCEYLRNVLSQSAPESDPEKVIPDYERINVDHYLNLSRAKLRHNLELLDEKMLNTVKACRISINEYKTLKQLNRDAKERIKSLEGELSLAKIEGKKIENELKQAKADMHELSKLLDKQEEKLKEQKLPDLLKTTSRTPEDIEQISTKKLNHPLDILFQ